MYAYRVSAPLWGVGDNEHDKNVYPQRREETHGKQAIAKNQGAAYTRARRSEST